MMSEIPAEGQQSTAARGPGGITGKGQPTHPLPHEPFRPPTGGRREAVLRAAALSRPLRPLHFQPSPRGAAAGCGKEPAASPPGPGHPTQPPALSPSRPPKKHALLSTCLPFGAGHHPLQRASPEGYLTGHPEGAVPAASEH